MTSMTIKRLLCDPYALAKGAVFVALAYLCLGLILPGLLGMWKETHTVSTFDVTPAMRRQLVATLSDKMARRYLDVQKGAQLAGMLERAMREGWYDGISSPTQFARELTRDLRDTSGDLHIAVRFSAAEVPDYGDRNFPQKPEEALSPPAWLIDRLGRSLATFGIEEVSKSAAGIGYIRLDAFFRPYLAGEKYAAALDEVADTRALIIDLRSNGGGSEDSVALLASYFFDQPTLLNEIVAPRSGERLQKWTRKDLEGKHYGMHRPVMILTSRDTFSAAEDFAYAMQTRKRATVVGEPTRGGAHPTAPFRLNTHFVLVLPVAETISPLTHTNWEGTGVRPDIVTDAARARSVATIAILKRQLASETKLERRADIQAWLRQER